METRIAVLMEQRLFVTASRMCLGPHSLVEWQDPQKVPEHVMTLQLQQDGATTLFRSRITDSASFIIKLPMAIFSFLLGLVVGSFINVVIRRGEKGEKLTGRSHCESCGKMLSFLELIPVLSYLVLRGRCRNCNAPFSLQYPLVELGTGILYATVAW